MTLHVNRAVPLLTFFGNPTFLSIPRHICSITLPLPYAFVHWRRFIHHHIPLCAPKLYSHKFPNLLLYLYASTTCHRGSLTFIHAAMQNNSIPLACRPLFPVLNLPPRHALSSFATECPFCLALHFDEEKGSFCCHEGNIPLALPSPPPEPLLSLFVEESWSQRLQKA